MFPARILTVCCLLTNVFALRVLGQTPTAPQTPGFRVEFIAKFETPGESRLIYTEARLVSSNGAWRILQNHANGKVVERYAEAGEGVFQLDRKLRKRRMLSPYKSPQADPLWRSVSGRLIRADKVAGLDVLVFEKQLPGGTIVVYRAPSLGGQIVKLVRNGPHNRFVLEAVNVVLEDPDLDLIEIRGFALAEKL